jgi:hypothetical protein
MGHVGGAGAGQGFDNFFSADKMDGKRACKLHLQHFLGLNQVGPPPRHATGLLRACTRLVHARV